MYQSCHTNYFTLYMKSVNVHCSAKKLNLISIIDWVNLLKKATVFSIPLHTGFHHHVHNSIKTYLGNTIKQLRSFPLWSLWSIINIPISWLACSKRVKGKGRPWEHHKNANLSHLFNANHCRGELKSGLIQTSSYKFRFFFIILTVVCLVKNKMLSC